MLLNKSLYQRSMASNFAASVMLSILLLPSTSPAQAGSPAGISAAQWPTSTPSPQLLQQYSLTNLVSDSPNTALAKTYDPNLRSPWEIAQTSTGPWFVANQASGSVTVYSGSGETQGTVIKVPVADPSKSSIGSPVAVVANPSKGFLLANGEPAEFLICTLDGLIAGWNAGSANSTAQVISNHKGQSVYEGFAVAPATINGVTSIYLYVPDFKASRVDVYDERFQHAPEIEQEFNRIPKWNGYAPFNFQTVGANLYLTFAKPAASLGGLFPLVQPGNGLIVAFSPEGRFVQVLQPGIFLNAPWAVTLAPGNFGLYSHDLLVGNNGDGKINVYNPVTGAFIDQLRGADNTPIAISGLWALQFGNNTELGGSALSLFFAASAGPTFTGGLFGTLTPVQNQFGNGN